ncbi:MAG: redoxin domain-containing protein [SAR202 cluster bacterium]|nr:hypothetical protein [Chloroflexota bacterium]MQG33441.1 redoxin domain-containing protein [SAR202 cluster bacterium]HAA95893.1 hypothetical protein [Dehalococcoidia bacterium]HCP23654.1 hypothetical protein [Dehalococcoidia bacterium]
MSHVIVVVVITAALSFLLACGGPSQDTAPDFSLPDSQGGEVVLAQLVQEHRSVVIVFYRGFF